MISSYVILMSGRLDVEAALRGGFLLGWVCFRCQVLFGKKGIYDHLVTGSSVYSNMIILASETVCNRVGGLISQEIEKEED